MSAEGALNRLGFGILELEEQVKQLRKYVDSLVNNPVFEGLSVITRNVEHAAIECKQSFEDYKQKKDK